MQRHTDTIYFGGHLFCLKQEGLQHSYCIRMKYKPGFICGVGINKETMLHFQPSVMTVMAP